MTLPVRTPNAELKDPRFPLVALVAHGANMHDWAPQVLKGDNTVKINPATKTAACKALGGLAERSVAMADAINKGEDDPNAPATLPEEMALSVTNMGSDFAQAMAAFMPKAAPAAPADPEVEMTAEMVTAAQDQTAKQSTALDAIEKVMKSKLTMKNVVNVAKGLDNIATVRKALAETAIAKGSGPKRLTFKQYTAMQGSLFESFMNLIMQFLPMLAEADEPAEAPAADPSAPPAVDMSKAIAEGVEKAATLAVAKAMEQVDEKLNARLAPVNDQLVLISKSRDGSNVLPPEARPSPGADKDGDMIPFQSLTERMRAQGKLPKAS